MLIQKCKLVLVTKCSSKKYKLRPKKMGLAQNFYSQKRFVNFNFFGSMLSLRHVCIFLTVLSKNSYFFILLYLFQEIKNFHLSEGSCF
jgi:hypothetical protein